MHVWEELLKTGLAIAGSYALYRFTLRQPHLTYFLGGLSSCAIPEGIIIWIYQITIQNTGKAPAKDVRVAHFYMPQHWQVIQTIGHTIEKINGLDRIIHFASIEPGVVVTIAYMDNDYQRIMGAHDHVRFEEGVVKPTPVQLQRVFPKRLSVLMMILSFLGIYLVVTWMVAFISMVWPLYQKW